MHLKYQQRLGYKKFLPLMVVALLWPFMLFNYQSAEAMTPKTEQICKDKIARGIEFQINKYTNYKDSGKNESEFIVTANLNDPTVDIFTGKAQDKVLQLETVTEQIAREQKKGKNIAAGINADMFNIGVGTIDSGTPMGLQVKDGQLLIGFASKDAETRLPVFAITKERQPIIGYLSMDARISAVDALYESKHGCPNPDQNLTTSIDAVNRIQPVLMNERMILATPQLAANPTIGFTDEQALNAVFTVLKIAGSPDGSVKLGKQYEARVVSLENTYTGTKSINIPSDRVVLASHGIKADWVNQHLHKGDKVRFSINFHDAAGKNLDLDQAVSGWLPLVEKGHALTTAEMLSICMNDGDSAAAALIAAPNKARTAIGYTADNKVIALIFDGGGAVKDSFGISLPGIAERMKELGAIAAISLDSGGSTQMNVRPFGENDVQVIDNPSDDGERPVTNTLLFASDILPKGDIKELRVNQDIVIYKNTPYAFQVRAQDSNGHPVDLTKANIKWELKPDSTLKSSLSGYVSRNGFFTAGYLPATERIYASSGKVSSFANVTVVDSVSSLALTDNGILAMDPYAKKQFQIVAHTQDGQPIVISNAAARWSVTPSSMGSIDGNGLFNARGKGSAVVKARVGDKEASIDIVVGQDDQMIDSYESSDPNCYSINGYVGGKCQLSKEQVREGSSSLRIDYDYSEWTKEYNGTINVLVDPSKKGPNYTSKIRPKKLAMWVYGDGQAPWLRAIIKDGNNNIRTVNLASRIDWTGWKYLEADIPADISTPLTLDYIYMVETNKGKNLKGTVYFDDVHFIYSSPDTGVQAL